MEEERKKREGTKFSLFFQQIFFNLEYRKEKLFFLNDKKRSFKTYKNIKERIL